MLNHRCFLSLFSLPKKKVLFFFQVQAYLYDGYWEDIGTIEAFYNANLGITKKPVPDFRSVALTAITKD